MNLPKLLMLDIEGVLIYSMGYIKDGKEVLLEENINPQAKDFMKFARNYFDEIMFNTCCLEEDVGLKKILKYMELEDIGFHNWNSSSNLRKASEYERLVKTNQIYHVEDSLAEKKYMESIGVKNFVVAPYFPISLSKKSNFEPYSLKGQKTLNEIREYLTQN